MFNYVRADHVWLTFDCGGVDSGVSTTLASIFKKTFTLPKSDVEGGLASSCTKSSTHEDPDATLQNSDAITIRRPTEQAENEADRLHVPEQEVNEGSIIEQHSGSPSQISLEEQCSEALSTHDTLSSISSSLELGESNDDDFGATAALCPFCNTGFDNDVSATVLTAKGVEGIMAASKKRQDKTMKCSVGQKVHTTCRQDYTHEKRIATAMRKRNEKARSESPSLRPREITFNFRTDCFFCGTQIVGKEVFFPCRTLSIKQAILKKCDERQDVWSDQVRERLSMVHDLHAADAIYHQKCSTNFRTMRVAPPDSQPSKKHKVGRPVADMASKAFDKVVEYLTLNDDEQITVKDLVSYMESLLVDSPSLAYSSKWMKHKLKEKFGDEIVFTNLNRKADVATFRSKASTILYDYFKSTSLKENSESEKELLIATAAKILRADIKHVETNLEEYPDVSESDVQEHTNYLPSSLQLFLKTLMVNERSALKQAAIGQAIMQATRPRVLLAPLQLSLGVQMHHLEGSKIVIDQLNKFGFVASYKEVQKFKKNAAVAADSLMENSCVQFVQYAADNVDHNSCTLDGKNTFHGMGMLAAVTPATKFRCVIPRKTVTTEEIRNAGRVEIVYGPDSSKGLANFFYKPLQGFVHNDPTADFDVIWKTSLLFGKPRPSWSGTMEHVHKGSHPEKASILFLPMIDLSPSDPVCIRSTMHYIAKHAATFNNHPVLTFDQPLYHKALQIKESEPSGSPLKGIVLKIGGLHTIMSFLGSIGHLMANTGLSDALETVYAKNTIEHMMSGKAISRAIRGHFLVDAVLNGLLLERSLKRFGPDLPPAPLTAPDTSPVQDESRLQSVSADTESDLMTQGTEN